MSETSDPRQKAHDPRLRPRSAELLQLLAHCPEHLFSTDDRELAPIRIAPKPANATDAKPADLKKVA